MLIEEMIVHNELNQKIWDGTTLRPEVKDKILEIVEFFKDSLDVDINIIDVILVGSNASYNYNEQSDLDVHIITNSEFLNIPTEIAQVLYNTLKTKFTNKYDISIHGVSLELYIEDIKTNVTSNGIYSVLNDKWIKFPKKIIAPKTDIGSLVSKWENYIEDVIKSNSSEKIMDTINKISLIRKNSIAVDGEYGKGNLLFKQLRNDGYMKRLKDSYSELKSKELSLENLPLEEDSRAQMINKSKSSPEGLKRFKNRVKTKVATTSAKYNNINMDKLFNDNILSVDVEVKGETDTYNVKVSFGGFLDILHDQLKDNPEISLKEITRALITGFNRNDVYVHCDCPDFQYRYDFFATKNNINSGDPQNTPSNITNPDDSLGSACKHVLNVLSNSSWLLKVAIVIYNYIKYMKSHEEKMYQDIIYPAIYKKRYNETLNGATAESGISTSEDNENATDSDISDSESV